MADPQIRAIHAMAASGRFIPYRRRVFPVPNIPAVPEKPVFYTKCLRTRIAYRRRLFCAPSASENASRTVGGCSAHRVPIPYRRRVFPVPNFPAVPQPKRVRVSALTYPMYKDSRMGALLFFCSLVSLISPTAHQPLINRK